MPSIYPQKFLDACFNALIVWLEISFALKIVFNRFRKGFDSFNSPDNYLDAGRQLVSCVGCILSYLQAGVLA